MKHLRRALHEIADLLADAIEADAREPEATPAPARKPRRAPRQAPPVRPLSDFTPEQLARVRAKM